MRRKAFRALMVLCVAALTVTLSPMEPLQQFAKFFVPEGIGQAVEALAETQKREFLEKDISANKTLHSDTLYVVPSGGILLHSGVTLTIEPGTQIQFYSKGSMESDAKSGSAYLQVEGVLNCEGTADNPVNMFLYDEARDKGYGISILTNYDGKANFKYTTVEAPGFGTVESQTTYRQTFNVTSVDHCKFTGGVFNSTENSIYRIHCDSMTNSIVTDLLGSGYCHATKMDAC